MQVFGISFDEQSRAKLSRDRWAIFEYPLVERRLVRQAVIDLAAIRFPGRAFPRSACIGCPYRSNAEWRWLRDNDPAGWEDACRTDEQIRVCGRLRGLVYLHRSCVPLREAILDDDPVADFGFGMGNECEGMCGV